MSYRSLHILLIVLLLVLDVLMVNLAGIGAFWLRCQTAVFDEPDRVVQDLLQDTTPWVGLASRVQYRVSDEDQWKLLSHPLAMRRVTDPVLEVDFRDGAMVETLTWSLSTASQSLPSVEMIGMSGAPVAGKVTYDASVRLVVAGLKRPVTYARVSLSGDVAVGPVTIHGYDPDRSALFSQPKTKTAQQPYWYLLGVWNLAALFWLLFSGAYRITRSLEVLDDFFLAMKAVGIATVSVVVILFLYRGYQEATYWGFEYSRIVVILGAVFATLLLTLNRALVDAAHSAFLKRGIGIRKVVVVGAGTVGQGIVDRLRKHYWLAYDPVAFVDDNPATHGKTVLDLPVMGGTEKLPDVARATGTNEVIVALPNSSHKSVRDIVGRCKDERFKLHILPDLFEVISSDVRVGAIDGVPVLDLDDAYLGKWDRCLKRGLDVTAVLLGSIVLSPLWLMVSSLIKVTSRGPVLYTQARVGEHGKMFSCFKFRTMRVVSEDEAKAERKDAYASLIDGKEETGKIVNVSRVTGIGRMLRKYRLDELPQILNVLRGEMSLVGPRPPIPYEVEHYNSWHMERLKGMPGISGLWQVSGGAALSFEEMVKLDIYYLGNWSLWLDFKILLKTVPVVLGGKGS